MSKSAAIVLRTNLGNPRERPSPATTLADSLASASLPARSATAAFCEAWTGSSMQVLGTVGVAGVSTVANELLAQPPFSAGQLEHSVLALFAGAGCLKGRLVSADSFVPAPSAAYRVTGDSFPEISLLLLLDAELCKSLAALPDPHETEASADSQSPTTHETSTAPDEREEVLREKEESRALPLLPPSLELVLDAELQPWIRLGTREMLLREVAALVPGVVVELNRMVHEPAELLVANHSLARGELVLVNGRLGLRITEVAALPERAAALAD